MNNEHNPIAQLIEKIQNKWMTDISPYKNIQLVRWLIEPDQKKLYEGFLRLESSPHGSLPEVPIVMLTHFEDKETYSKNLITDWLNDFIKDEELQKELAEGGLSFDWDSQLYQDKCDADEADYNLLLLEMLQSFQKAMPNSDYPLVLSLFPYGIDSNREYAQWIDDLVKLGLPDKVRLMFFDEVDKRDYDPLMKNHPEISKSLQVPMNFDEAINKLATSGNPNDPEVQFRKCMIEMSNSVSKKDVERLHLWGEKGLSVTQKSGSKAALAAAYMVYAGMLFNFKDYEKIEKLVQSGMAAAKQGLLGGDEACKSTIIQAYGFMASCKQLQKKKDDAADLYCQQADKAIEYGFNAMALMPYWLAYNVVKNWDNDRYLEILTMGYELGKKLSKEELQASCMQHIGFDYFELAEDRGDLEKCASINQFMTETFEADWKEKAEQNQQQMNKKSFSFF